MCIFLNAEASVDGLHLRGYRFFELDSPHNSADL